MKTSKHVVWARKIKAVAQIGLEYAQDPYDRGRYEELQALAAEMMAEASDVPFHRWMDLFEKESGYLTPRVDVRGAVFRDGRVLLSREMDDGCWSLPGGWADVNDPPSVAVEREVLEETGYAVRCTKLAAVLDRDLHYNEDKRPVHTYKLMFLCEIVGEGGELDHDISEARFFPIEELPPLSLHRTLPKQIRTMFSHHQNPELPAEFD
ncbi:NUDIX hydrolase [Pontiella agarivorans]|uniref:NUDIX hydrolase N-terminal domain-containing protein n=1 Tax=Pontiella agarivorans TaxID=3038953 RepID=A0ABU5MUU4_9BACT|nr:NUDIX hydrolase N-terminal domain-containing protein [Pontiella agarivorans]MDZ8117980.1 NUDIX hydrolase N-terminal domain-containing protein [Pontiella agarivorans]